MNYLKTVVESTKGKGSTSSLRRAMEAENAYLVVSDQVRKNDLVSRGFDAESILVYEKDTPNEKRPVLWDKSVVEALKSSLDMWRVH